MFLSCVLVSFKLYKLVMKEGKVLFLLALSELDSELPEEDVQEKKEHEQKQPEKQDLAGAGAVGNKQNGKGQGRIRNLLVVDVLFLRLDLIS